MPRQLAALICMVFIISLFWRDLKKSDRPSNALWIPLMWMFLAGSRYVSQWLNLGAPIQSVDDYFEGSPVDRMVFLVLIAAGIIILLQRRLDWGRLVTQNRWIFLYFLFGIISILWSDYPFVSFKRWIKASGNVIMALVILTEKHPYEAVGVVLRRLAFLLIPLSVLFIKYYPQMGRIYHKWTYLTMFTGVSTGKNGLGQMCMIAGICFCWYLLVRRTEAINLGKRLHVLAEFVFLGMIVWLLHKADSATSLTCLVVAVAVFFMSRLPIIARAPGRIMVLGVVMVLVFGVLEIILDVSGFIIAMLGRDPTLTTRVPMWEMLLGMDTNPFLGVGYESFWLGDRLEELWRIIGGRIQAHNGYLEVYLNLGLIGLTLLLLSMLSGLMKVRAHLDEDYPSAILRLCIIVVIALYNWTEATFYGVNNMWLVLFLGILDIQGQQKTAETGVIEEVRNSG